jgi:hypothetical protein
LFWLQHTFLPPLVQLIVVLGAKSSFVHFSPSIAAFGSLLSQTGVLSSRRSLTKKHIDLLQEKAQALNFIFSTSTLLRSSTAHHVQAQQRINRSQTHKDRKQRRIKSSRFQTEAGTQTCSRHRCLAPSRKRTRRSPPVRDRVTELRRPATCLNPVAEEQRKGNRLTKTTREQG